MSKPTDSKPTASTTPATIKSKRRMQQGREAYQLGHPIKSCPFDGRTQDGRWWRMGWMAAADTASAEWWEQKLGGKKS